MCFLFLLDWSADVGGVTSYIAKDDKEEVSGIGRARLSKPRMGVGKLMETCYLCPMGFGAHRHG